MRLLGNSPRLGGDRLSWRRLLGNGPWLGRRRRDIRRGKSLFVFLHSLEGLLGEGSLEGLAHKVTQFTGLGGGGDSDLC